MVARACMVGCKISTIQRLRRNQLRRNHKTMAGILAANYLEYVGVSCRVSYLVYMLRQSEGFTMRNESWPDDLGYDLWYCTNCNTPPTHVVYLECVECAACGAKVMNYQKAMAMKYSEINDGLPWRWGYAEEYYKYVRLHRQCASPVYNPSKPAVFYTSPPPPLSPQTEVIYLWSDEDDEETGEVSPPAHGKGTPEDPVDLTLDD